MFCNIYRDDHQFSPLHWAAKGGHTKIVEMLMSRGARVHTTNMGDDTPLHLAAAFGNRDILLMVGLYGFSNTFNTIAPYFNCILIDDLLIFLIIIVSKKQG